jgi:hypothetical protein
MVGPQVRLDVGEDLVVAVPAGDIAALAVDDPCDDLDASLSSAAADSAYGVRWPLTRPCRRVDVGMLASLAEGW